MSPAFDYAKVADLYDAYVRYDEDVPYFLEACRAVAARLRLKRRRIS